MKEIDARTDWEVERTRLQKEIQRLETALVLAKEVAPNTAEGNLNLEYVTKLCEAEQELEEASEKWRQERRRLVDEIESLETALRKARAGGRSADVQDATVEDLRNKIAAQHAELEAVREELLTRVATAEDEKSRTEDQLRQAQAAWEEERAELVAQIGKSTQQARLTEGDIETRLREKLTAEYEWKLKEFSFQKEQLEQKLKEYRPVSPALSDSAGSDPTSEVARVDEKIAEITAFIDDPNSPLSKVVRKNVERSELEAYRRGLTYRAGDDLND